MTKVLVTGGGGFIGSHIVDKLLENGYNVHILDRKKGRKKKFINKKAKFHNMDIRSKNVERVFKKERFDYVIHQAAQVDVTLSIKDPITDAEINILGSLNILQNCIKYSVKKIVYGNSGGAGSGEPVYLPVDEGHPIKPLSPYGISKHTIEHYLFAFRNIYGLRYVSLRYANVYGPRQYPYGEGGVVAIFVNKLLNNENPVIYGNGKQTRDFVYVGDVADANIVAMLSEKEGEFNVCTGKEITINELFQKIKEITKSGINARYVKARKGEIIRSVLSPKKINKILGWKAKTSLVKGIKETIDFFISEGMRK